MSIGIVNVPEIEKALDELVALYHSKQAAGETYTEAVKRVAEKAQCPAKILRKLVTAKAKESEAEVKEEAETVSALLDSISII